MLILKLYKKEQVKIGVLCFMFMIFAFINYQIRLERFNNLYANGPINSKGEILTLLSEGEVNNKYMIRLFDNNKMIIYIPKTITINLNDIISFNGTFEKPIKAMNKGGFNNALYLYSKNIYGSIYLYNNNSVEVIDNKFSLINTIKTSIYDVLGQIFPKEQLGIILGMIIGDTFYISDDIQEAFKNSRNYTSSCSFTVRMLHM